VVGRLLLVIVFGQKEMTEKTSPRPPVSVLIGRQLDQEKIDVLSKRVQV
jgi:hypothetical protein